MNELTKHDLCPAISYYMPPAAAAASETASVADSGAIKDFDSVIRHNNSINAKIYFRLGCANIQLKNYNDAVKDLQTALSYHNSSLGNNAAASKDVSIAKKLQEALKLKEAEKKKEEKKYSAMFA